MCFIAHAIPWTSLSHGLQQPVEFGKGLGDCLGKGVLQLLSKVQRTTISPALGHRKPKAHCIET